MILGYFSLKTNVWRVLIQRLLANQSANALSPLKLILSRGFSPPLALRLFGTTVLLGTTNITRAAERVELHVRMGLGLPRPGMVGQLGPFEQ